jgi:hypothetical protein
MASGSFIWTDITPPGATGALAAVSGTGPTNVWVASATGQLWTWTGCNWVQRSPPSIVQFYSVLALPDGGAMASGRTSSNDVALSCITGASCLSNVNGVRGLCGRNGQVYAAVSNLGNYGLQRYEPGINSWSKPGSGDTSSEYDQCWVDPTGLPVLISSEPGLARYDGPGNLVAEATTAGPNERFVGIFGTGGLVFAGGSDKFIVQRTASTAWGVVYNGAGTGFIRSMHGPEITVAGQPAIVAGGDYGSNGGSVHVWLNSNWSSEDPPGPAMNVAGVYAASAKEFFIVGALLNGIPRAYHARRP